MKHVEVEMLSETVNCPVVRIPQRRFPGIVLQGDSLKILLDLAEDVFELSAVANSPDLTETAVALKDKLTAYVNAYEQTMQMNGLELPYSKTI